MKYQANGKFNGYFKNGYTEIDCMTIDNAPNFCIHEVKNIDTGEIAYRVSHKSTGYYMGFEALSFSNAYRLLLSYEKRLGSDRTTDIKQLIGILSPVKSAFDKFLKLQEITKL